MTVLLAIPYALNARADVDTIYALFRNRETPLWRARGGPGPSLLPWNRHYLGHISRLLYDLRGVTDPELLAELRALEPWARYETYVLAPLILLSILSGLAWGMVLQMAH